MAVKFKTDDSDERLKARESLTELMAKHEVDIIESNIPDDKKSEELARRINAECEEKSIPIQVEVLNLEDGVASILENIFGNSGAAPNPPSDDPTHDKIKAAGAEINNQFAINVGASFARLHDSMSRSFAHPLDCFPNTANVYVHMLAGTISRLGDHFEDANMVRARQLMFRAALMTIFRHVLNPPSNCLLRELKFDPDELYDDLLSFREGQETSDARYDSLKLEFMDLSTAMSMKMNNEMN